MKVLRKGLLALLGVILAGAFLFFVVFPLAAPYQYHNVCYKISNLTMLRLPSLWSRGGSSSGEEIPQASEDIAAWLASEGLDTSVDPDYPDVTMTALQGRWLWKNLGGDSEELYFDGNQCTVTISYLDMEEETYDCAILNRSAAGLCPKLVIFEYPGETAGLTYYITEVSDDTFYCAAQEMLFYRVE
ncbi:MAG: hypothetical protein LUD84_01675 [Clostridiales bacterium]|nr:hypothetical protein [Clostridiales bacterium]